MSRSAPDFNQVKENAQADREEIRSQAMQQLLFLAQEDTGIHRVVLPIFRAAVSAALDPLTAESGAKGIELIRGRDEGRTAWLSLLSHSNEEIVASAVFSLSDNFYVPALITVLNHRQEVRIHGAIIRYFGRIKASKTLPVILDHLAKLETRSDAIIALEQLEEPDAVRHLEPLMNDDADSGMTDDRGVSLSTGTIASLAVRRLRYVTHKKTVKPDSSPVAPADDKPNDRAPSTSVGGSSSRQSAVNLMAFVPLAAAFLEVAWFALVIFVQLFTTGAVAKNEAQVHQLDVIVMIPAALGMVIGLIVIVSGSVHRRCEKVCLYLGCLACGAAIFCFSREFFH